MDVQKMMGLIQAIEAEAKQPNPNHGNLARLTSAALTEIMDFLAKLSAAMLPILAVKQYQGMTGLATPAQPVADQTTLGGPVTPISEPEVLLKDQAESTPATAEEQTPEAAPAAPEEAPAA